MLESRAKLTLALDLWAWLSALAVKVSRLAADFSTITAFVSLRVKNKMSLMGCNRRRRRRRRVKINKTMKKKKKTDLTIMMAT